MKNFDIRQFKNSVNSLNPKEPHNWPIWAIMMVGIIIFIVLLALGTALHLIEKYDALNMEQQKEVKLKTDFIERKKQSINLPLYKKQLEEVTLASDILLKQLPNKSQMDKLLVDINQAAIGRGLEIELFKPNNEKLYNFYAELPISIKVSGDYESIGNFSADVSKLSRVVLFNDIALIPKDNRLTLETTAKTFRYLDAEELERQRQAAAEVKKAARDKASKNKPDKK